MKNNQIFTRADFACKCGCGFDAMDYELLTVLEKISNLYGPIAINCACRCVKHNASAMVGGKPKSQHIFGKAADIKASGLPPDKLQEFLCNEYNDKYGIGKYKTFTHIDVRNGKARW